MLVQPENVVHYLAERRLLTLQSVVEGDFMVFDQSSRNYNLKVLRRKSPGFFIKQVRTRTSAYTLTLEREAKCYEMAARNPRFGAMAALLPRCHHWDAARTILVLEMLPDAESLWEHHQRLGRFPREIAESSRETSSAPTTARRSCSSPPWRSCTCSRKSSPGSSRSTRPIRST